MSRRKKPTGHRKSIGRKTGFVTPASIPWGSHLCVLYSQPEDLIDLSVRYFEAGLQNSELGFWITSRDVSVKEAEDSLRANVPGAEKYFADHQMEIQSHAERYVTDGDFHPGKVLSDFKRRASVARTRGYDGIRISGNTPWIKKRQMKEFLRFEGKVGALAENNRMIVICTYSLHQYKLTELMDAVERHDSVLIKRKRKWYQIQTSDRAKMEETLRNALQERLEERSAQLQRSLESEQELRKISEERREKLLLLSRRLVELQESERRKIAWELHDEIGQQLTAIKLQIESLGRRFGGDTNATKAVESSVNELIERVRDLSLNLRPTILDDLGLVPALLWLIKRYSSQTEIKAEIKHKNVDGRRFPSEMETAAYRVVQEALTNIARHSSAKEAFILVEADAAFVRITIKDHGSGFDVQSTLRSNKSTGLSGMIERAEAAGGKITISSSVDVGTTVHVELPLNSSSSNLTKNP